MSSRQVAVDGSDGLQLGYGPGRVVKPAFSRSGRSAWKPLEVLNALGTSTITGRLGEVMLSTE